MNPAPQLPTQAPALPDREAPLSPGPEAHVRAQAKARKKERKAERLRFFFGWCEGCRAFGEGF
ncbi:MAG TPA: hypothetical protein VF629_19330 [Hymenobacter sp.]|jgi:hypothetical protein|uniref:hypothetical protein n=1 Tax=Hymenobacter sp. TaxID=1898978 RepID=UPI002ED85513